jgi:hypothetical protein
MQRVILKRFSIEKTPDGVKNGKEECAYFRISCHSHRFNHLNFKYMYRISYGNAIKANPLKWSCPH